jgi:hypothetical protein
MCGGVRDSKPNGTATEHREGVARLARNPYIYSKFEVVGGGQRASSAAALPSGERSLGRGVYKTSVSNTHKPHRSAAGKPQTVFTNRSNDHQLRYQRLVRAYKERSPFGCC